MRCRLYAREVFRAQKISRFVWGFRILSWIPVAGCAVRLAATDDLEWFGLILIGTACAITLEWRVFSKLPDPPGKCKCRGCRHRKISDKRWESFVGEWKHDEQVQLRRQASRDMR